MQKKWNTLPATMITEIMHFNRLLWWLQWHRRLAVLTNNEECFLLRSTTCFRANVYMFYDYVHVDNLSDISAY